MPKSKMSSKVTLLLTPLERLYGLSLKKAFLFSGSRRCGLGAGSSNIQVRLGKLLPVNGDAYLSARFQKD